MVHKVTRSRNLVTFLSRINLGASYRAVMNLEQRIATAVTERIEQTGGVFVPPFLKTGKQPFFAIDNIDFMECTPDGQNTIHGTIIVVNQDNEADGIPLSEQLDIPKKAKNVSLPIANTDAPRLLSPKKIVTFSKYVFGFDEEIIAGYQFLDKIWFFARFLHKHSQSPLLSESYPKYQDEKASNDKPTCNRPKSMPTWAATNSRIIAASDQTTPSKTMTGIVSPLFRYLTDLKTLYKALYLAQDISAVVTGPN